MSDRLEIEEGNYEELGLEQELLLRDRFASIALRARIVGTHWSPEAYAREAYAVADAMLRERRRR